MICLCLLYAAPALRALRGRVATTNSVAQLEPYATSDSLLQILGVPHPSELIENGLSRFPPNSRLLFVGPSREQFITQVYYTVSYLAYPRAAGGMFCSGPAEGTLIELVPPGAPIDGIVYFETDPGPAAANGTHLLPNLYLVPHNGPVAWKSLCR